MNMKLAVFTIWPILKKEAPLLYVLHDEEGDWQFLCDEEVTDENAAIVSMQNMVNLYPSVETLFEMPQGSMAMRNQKTGEWEISTH